MKTRTIFVATICTIILLTLYLHMSYNRLSPRELTNVLCGKMGIHQSLSKPNRIYKIVYNLDETFTMDVIENNNSVGKTKGYYKVISNYNIGYIDITYTDVAESPYIESPFSKYNENNVYKTMKNLLGPFTLHSQSNRTGYILEYGHLYGKSNKFMTMFGIE